MKQYVASLSYGKDSMAMLHVITDVLRWPLDRIITADVWATDTIPADLPPMVEFKDYADKEIKRRWGIEVEHFCAMKNGARNNYDRQFYTKVSDKRHEARLREWVEARKGFNKNGKTDIYGFPLTGRSWCNNFLKTDALGEAKKTYSDVFYHKREKGERKGEIYGWPFKTAPICMGELKRPVFEKIKCVVNESIEYVGIAADEGQRTERHKKKAKQGTKKLPLVEAGWTEQMCREWCEENGLLSPTYTTATRGGCWFCHNQGVDQLRLLRKNYPDLWALLLKWDNDSPVTFKADGHTVHDYDKRFEWEDRGFIPNGKTFRWSDIDNAQMNIGQFIDIPDNMKG